MNVVVTGGGGRVGRYIVSELVAHGYDVTNADRVGAPEEGVRFIRVESTDLGEIVAALKGAEAVVHMAAIPDPLTDPEHVVFRVNMLSNWNVLEAAEIHGIRKVVMASSINAIGATFSKAPVPPPLLPDRRAAPDAGRGRLRPEQVAGRGDGGGVLPPSRDADREPALPRAAGR